MLVIRKALNGTHMRTSQRNRGVEHKRRLLATEEDREVTARAFSAHGRPLEMETSSIYLGRVILEADGGCTAGVRNLYRARAVWRRMACILRREGAALRVSGFFFKAVV